MSAKVNFEVVAGRLKELRKNAKKSQQEIATYLGMDRSTYTCYETGRRLPMSENLFALAELYNVSVDYILGRTDNPRLHIQDVETEKGTAELRVSKPLTEEEIEKFRELLKGM